MLDVVESERVRSLGRARGVPEGFYCALRNCVNTQCGKKLFACVYRDRKSRLEIKHSLDSIITLLREGLTTCDIIKRMKVSVGGVHKTIRTYEESGEPTVLHLPFESPFPASIFTLLPLN